MDHHDIERIRELVRERLVGTGWLKELLCRFPGMHSRASYPTGRFGFTCFGGVLVQYHCPRCNKIYWK